MKISYIISLGIIIVCSAVLASANITIHGWHYWVIVSCLIGYGMCATIHKGEPFKKKEKADKYSIEDAIKDRQSKNYMKEVNEITEKFNKWLNGEIKRNLRDTNNQVVASFEISSVCSKLKYGDFSTITGSLTFEVYEVIKSYVKEICEKYNFMCIESGQINCATEGHNGVKFSIQYETVESKKI